MPRALPSRRLPRHHLMLHRAPPPKGRSDNKPGGTPVRLSDLILGLLGVTLLGGLALMAVAALMARAVTP